MASKIDLNSCRGKADIKDYEITTFCSGFEVLRISSQKLCESQGATDPLAAVSMCVEVGSFSDPDIAQGLAHFLEHMIFMGSEKYPNENAYDSYVSSHGGSCNAMTEGEYTIYQFVVSGDRESFAHALDIFAQCLISPLLSSSCSDREINSIESEFQLAKTSDGSRMQQIFCGNCTNTTVPAGEKTMDLDSQHVLKKFGWGNHFSLKTVPMEKGCDISAELRDFYRQHYTPDKMKLVVLSPLPMDQIDACVSASFAPWMQPQNQHPDQPEGQPPTATTDAKTHGASPLQKKQKKVSETLENTTISVLPPLSALLSGQVVTGIPIYDRYPQHHAFPMLIGPPSRVVRMVPIKNTHSLAVKFQLPCITGLYGQKLESYYGHLFGHEGKGSMLSLLKRLSFATGLSAGIGSDSVSCNSVYSIFEIYFNLTSSGVSNWPFVVSILYEYIHHLRTVGPQEWVFDELKKMAKIEYDYLDEVDEEEYVESMAIEMSASWNRERTDLLSAAFLYREFNPENLISMLTYFTPENAVVELMSSCYRKPGEKRSTSSDNDSTSESSSDDEGSDDDEDDDEEEEEEEEEEVGADEEEVNIEALYQGPAAWLHVVQNPFLCAVADADADISSAACPSGSKSARASTDTDNSDDISLRIPTEEPYFGTQYFDDLIPADIVHMWRHISAHGSSAATSGDDAPEGFPGSQEYAMIFGSVSAAPPSASLHLPCPNIYIPDISFSTEGDSGITSSNPDGESVVEYSTSSQQILLPEPSGCAALYGVLTSTPISKGTAATDWNGDDPIPTNSTTSSPSLLQAEDGFHCWLYPNDKYKHLPKIDIRLVLYSPEICKSPLHRAKTDLLISVVKEFLQDTDLYPASLCDLEASLYNTNDIGIGISVQGYSDKSFRLLHRILSTLISPDTFYCREDDDGTINNTISSKYDLLLRNYRNYDMSASRAASHARLSLLNQIHYGAEETRVALENECKNATVGKGSENVVSDAYISGSGVCAATLRMMLSAHAKNILRQACVNMMVHGNCAPDVARSASAQVWQTLNDASKMYRASQENSTGGTFVNTCGLSWSYHPGKRTVKIARSSESAVKDNNSKKGKKAKKTASVTHYIYHVTPGNPIEANVCCEIYYQLPHQDHSTCASVNKKSPYFLDLLYLTLLEELLTEPFFDRLRTQQQLGYSVSCSYKNNCGVLGFQFAVTSSLYSAATIESSVFQFVDSISTTLLPGMSDDLFGQYVTAFVSKQTKVEANLVAHANKYIWDSISDRDYAFSLYPDCAEFLKTNYTVGAPGSAGSKSLMDLKMELIAFANRLFTGSDAGAPNSQNVLIVRSYHEHINAQKQNGFNCDSNISVLEGSCGDVDDVDKESGHGGKSTAGGRMKRPCLCGERNKAKAGTDALMHCQICLPLTSGAVSTHKKVKEVLVRDMDTDFHSALPTYENLI